MWRSAAVHPIRVPGLKPGDFGDQEFRCLSACARLVISPKVEYSKAYREAGRCSGGLLHCAAAACGLRRSYNSWMMKSQSRR